MNRVREHAQHGDAPEMAETLRIRLFEGRQERDLIGVAEYGERTIARGPLRHRVAEQLEVIPDRRLGLLEHGGVKSVGDRQVKFRTFWT